MLRIFNRKEHPKISIILMCLGVLLFSPFEGRAEIDSALRAQGWLEFTFDDKQENRFIKSGPDQIEVLSERSVSIAYLPFSEGELDLLETPYLSFAWQHEGQIVDTDISKKGGDDRILAIYLAFPYQSEHASFAEKLMRPFVVASQGRDAPGRLLTYAWAGAPAPGQWFENPYTGKAGYMKVLQSASDETNQPESWRFYKLDIVADFKDRFGYRPPAPSYVAIGVDSDDTGSRFTARVRNLGFVK